VEHGSRGPDWTVRSQTERPEVTTAEGSTSVGARIAGFCALHPWLNLKDVERYIGVKRASREVLDGLDAVSEYRRYRRLPAASPKKAALREELIAYNRDDLRGLVRVVERLKEFTHAGKT